MEEMEHEHHHHEHHHHEDGECCCGHHHHHDEECHHEHHHYDHDEECCCGHEHHHHDEECHHEHHHHEHHHEHGEDCTCGCHDHDHHHHHHHADDVFTSWGCETVKAYSKEKLEEILSGFEKYEEGTILRSKGIVKAEGSDEWLYFDYVPGQIDIRYGSKDSIGKICVIAAGLSEDELEKMFA